MAKKESKHVIEYMINGVRNRVFPGSQRAALLYMNNLKTTEYLRTGDFATYTYDGEIQRKLVCTDPPNKHFVEVPILVLCVEMLGGTIEGMSCRQITGGIQPIVRDVVFIEDKQYATEKEHYLKGTRLFIYSHQAVSNMGGAWYKRLMAAAMARIKAVKESGHDR